MPQVEHDGVDIAFESGRVVCSLPSGSKVWEE